MIPLLVSSIATPMCDAAGVPAGAANGERPMISSCLRCDPFAAGDTADRSILEGASGSAAEAALPVGSEFEEVG